MNGVAVVSALHTGGTDWSKPSPCRPCGLIGISHPIRAHHKDFSSTWWDFPDPIASLELTCGSSDSSFLDES